MKTGMPVYMLDMPVYILLLIFQDYVKIKENGGTPSNNVNNGTTRI